MSAIDRILAWDERLLLRVCTWQRPRLVKVFRAVTHLGDTTSVMFLGMVLFFTGTQANFRLAALLAAGSGGAALLAQVVKRLSRRRRPTSGIAGFEALVMNPDAFSFPSGHTAGAVGMAVVWAGEPGLGPFAAALATAIAFSRVYLGAHYPLDVLAGALIGAVMGSLARAVV